MIGLQSGNDMVYLLKKTLIYWRIEKFLLECMNIFLQIFFSEFSTAFSTDSGTGIEPIFMSFDVTCYAT